MCVEMMLNSVNLTLIAFAPVGQPQRPGLCLYGYGRGAAEVAVGLAILIAHFNLSKSTNIDDVNVMKWWQ